MEASAAGCATNCSPTNAFNTLLEARVLVKDWRIEYNTVRPQSASGYLIPTGYAKSWTATTPHSHSGWT